MAKTAKTRASVAGFIAGVRDENRRADARAVDKLFRAVTGAKPAMWGPSIIGYGEYQSPTGAWPRAAFSPRSTSLVLYLLPGLDGRAALLKKLGKHKSGASCVYIKRLADVDEGVLRELIARSWRQS